MPKEKDTIPQPIFDLVEAGKTHTCAAKVLAECLEKTELPWTCSLNRVALLAIQLHEFDHGAERMPPQNHQFWAESRKMEKELRALAVLCLPCELRGKYERLLGVELTEPVPCVEQVMAFIEQTYESGRDLIPVPGAVMATTGVLN